MKIKQITIRHPDLGEIEVNTLLPDEVNGLIGNTVNDHSKEPCFYHAMIVEKEDGTFDITNLNVVKPKTVNVGFHTTSYGSSSFITVVKNILAGENITVYPNGVVSVIYNKI